MKLNLTRRVLQKEITSPRREVGMVSGKILQEQVPPDPILHIH